MQEANLPGKVPRSKSGSKENKGPRQPSRNFASEVYERKVKGDGVRRSYCRYAKLVPGFVDEHGR